MKRKYAVILGNLGNTRDRFGIAYKKTRDSTETIAQAAAIPYGSGIELVGIWDIRPNNVKDMRSSLRDHGLTCISIIPDLFANPLMVAAAIAAIGLKYVARPSIARREHV